MNIEKTYKDLSVRFNLPIDTIKEIVQSEFKLTVNIMKDPNDYRDILINKSFKFKLKNRFKDDKTKTYSPK